MSSERSENAALTTSMRLDKWLWSARIFKTRALATAAVAGGKVHLNGTRVKPAHAVRAGDTVTVQHGYDAMTIAVRSLATHRGPAPVATKLSQGQKLSHFACSPIGLSTVKTFLRSTGSSQFTNDLAGGQSKPGSRRTSSHRLVHQETVRFSSRSSAQRLGRLCLRISRSGRNRSPHACSHRETNRPCAIRFVSRPDRFVVGASASRSQTSPPLPVKLAWMYPLGHLEVS